MCCAWVQLFRFRDARRERSRGNAEPSALHDANDIHGAYVALVVDGKP
jgi:hypothetical protein